jgi:nitrite reductase/ring-hydroxylating ferredoxin subunit
MKPTSDSVGRRAFLMTAVAGSLTALFGDWWAQRRAPVSPVVVPFQIAGTAELSPGGAVSFDVPGTPVAGVLVRLSNDTYAAFDRRCPHLGCPVQWSVPRERFECPCHAAVFDGSSGRVLAGPPRRGLRRIAIEQRGDQVWALRAGDDDEREERSV